MNREFNRFCYFFADAEHRDSFVDINEIEQISEETIFINSWLHIKKNEFEKPYVHIESLEMMQEVYDYYNLSMDSLYEAIEMTETLGYNHHIYENEPICALELQSSIENTGEADEFFKYGMRVKLKKLKKDRNIFSQQYDISTKSVSVTHYMGTGKENGILFIQLAFPVGQNSAIHLVMVKHRQEKLAYSVYFNAGKPFSLKNKRPEPTRFILTEKNPSLTETEHAISRIFISKLRKELKSLLGLEHRQGIRHASLDELSRYLNMINMLHI